MVRLKMHGFYDKIIDHAYVEGEDFINCYDDSAVERCITPSATNIALMIEPRSISPRGYWYLEDGGWKAFKYVFTHDSKLLELPNAKRISVGAVWCRYDVPKTKNVSMVCGFKEMCMLHKQRKELAEYLHESGMADVYGDWQYKKYTGWAEPSEYLRDYRCSVVIENYIDDIYFTEKIVNCFANKVVPIYVGARRISDFFNPKGILQFTSVDDVSRTFREIEHPTNPCFAFKGWEALYEEMKPYVADNYEISLEFSTFENRFFEVYGRLLSDLC